MGTRWARGANRYIMGICMGAEPTVHPADEPHSTWDACYYWFNKHVVGLLRDRNSPVSRHLVFNNFWGNFTMSNATILNLWWINKYYQKRFPQSKYTVNYINLVVYVKWPNLPVIARLSTNRESYCLSRLSKVDRLLLYRRWRQLAWKQLGQPGQQSFSTS